MSSGSGSVPLHRDAGGRAGWGWRLRIRLSTGRDAFSLIELLIVLAVLAGIATLTLPALRGPMDKSRLRGAARDMETAIAKARSLAIRTGQSHWFTYQSGGRAWQIETTAEAPSEDGDTTASGLTADGPQLETTQLVRSGLLPEGVTFATDVSEAIGLVEADGLLETEPKWSEPIDFTPIGRTQNREFIIRGVRDFEIHVRVRGLTGSASTRLERRIEPIDGDVLPSEEASETFAPTTERL